MDKARVSNERIFGSKGARHLKKQGATLHVAQGVKVGNTKNRLGTGVGSSRSGFLTGPNRSRVKGAIGSRRRDPSKQTVAVL